MKIRLSNILLFLFSIITTNFFAQERDSLRHSKPKIGLVLSGGGARGYAHIGVLKVLEEQGIKPDYITGTSQGAIIGALYALGGRATDIEFHINKIDWNRMLTDTKPLNEIPILFKNKYPEYPLQIYFNNGLKPYMPIGVIDGHAIQGLFSKLSWSSNFYKDFEDFPIPFRCLASDIVSGKPFVFQNGDLAEALRSSMAVPAYFTPVYKDSMVLVDGGVLRNFPVQECVDMGADIIIGVNVIGSEKRLKKEKINSLENVLTQTTQVFLTSLIQDDIDKADLVIQPDLDKYIGIEFKKDKDIISAGETAARDSIVFNKIKEIATLITPGEYDNQKNLLDFDKLWIDDICIEGCKYTNSKSIILLAELNKKTHITANEVDQAIDRIYTSGEFKKVTYKIEKKGTKTNLVFSVYEKDRNSLLFGIHYSLLNGLEGFIKANHKNVYLKSSEISFKGALAKNPRAQLQFKHYPQKIKNLELSLNSFAQYSNMPKYIEENESLFTLEYLNDLSINSNFKISWSPFKNLLTETSIGNLYNVICFKNDLALLYETNNVKTNHNYYDISLTINTLNHAVFPTKGLYIQAKYENHFMVTSKQSETYFSREALSADNSIFTFDYKHFIPVFKKLSIIPEFNLGTIKKDAIFTQKFFLGGYTDDLRPNRYNFSGVRSNYIVTDDFIMAGISLQYNMLNNLYFQIGGQGVYLENVPKYLLENHAVFKNHYLRGLYANVSYKSMFGSLSISLSRSLEHKYYVPSINIGVPF